MCLTLGRIAVNVAPVVTYLVAQGTPLFRAHALAAWLVSSGTVVVVSLRRTPVELLATLVLALGTPILEITATAATLPARARLRPHHL